jgi:AcrR family transcriptional regulator
MAKVARSRSSRKLPQQSRSRATVEAILEGAIRVLERHGPEELSTSRVAELAGVSVGTLYQYFENREAIVDALQEREFERAGEMLASTLSSSAFTSERALTKAVVGGLLALYRQAPTLHRLLAVGGLQLGLAGRVQEFDLLMVSRLRAFFDATPWPIRKDKTHATAFVLYQSVRASLLAYLLEQPAGLSDEDLVSELTDLILAHLLHPAAG